MLVDFWEYTCINCIRTFPYLRRWNELYGPLGLVIIGVHTPEFKFARDPALVASAARRFRLNFPIAVDSDYRIWRAFHNRGWPADYLIDKNGRVVWSHLGEGEYAAMERRIQALLVEANPKLSFSSAKYQVPDDPPMFGGTCYRPTPETYLGFARGRRIANQGGYQPFARFVYVAPRNLGLDQYALEGTWFAAPEYVRHAPSQGAGKTGSLSLHYRSKSVYLVAGSDDGKSSRLYVTQDGKPLGQAEGGVDVRRDASGRTYIGLGKKRMYYVVDNPSFGQHRLKLSASSPALSLYSFTFGSNCENEFDHR